MKKIRNPRTGQSKIHYFGRWGRVVHGRMQRLPGDGRQEALKLWNAQKDELLAGREPRIKSLDDLNADGTPKENPDVLTLRVLCNKFLTAKLRKKTAGEISHRTFLELKQTTDRLIAFFGKDNPVEDIHPEQFGELRADIATRWGPVRLANEITRIKSVFKYAQENRLIKEPICYGSEFQKPDKGVLRRHKGANGKKFIEAQTIRSLIEKADPVMKAMICLAINCGYGNTDLANLKESMVDFQRGWIDYPRPKTGIERENPLWPETIEALKAAIAIRPEPKDPADADCVFLRANGRRWVRHTESSRTDGIANEFQKLAKAAGVRKGLGIYSLRHTFQTIADTARDSIATEFLMGHIDASMSGSYREFVEDENLRVVVEHVRTWLFSKEGGAE